MMYSLTFDVQIHYILHPDLLLYVQVRFTNLAPLINNNMKCVSAQLSYQTSISIC